jgi:hypothetical protein
MNYEFKVLNASHLYYSAPYGMAQSIILACHKHRVKIMPIPVWGESPRLSLEGRPEEVFKTAAKLNFEFGLRLELLGSPLPEDIERYRTAALRELHEEYGIPTGGRERMELEVNEESRAAVGQKGIT